MEKNPRGKLIKFGMSCDRCGIKIGRNQSFKRPKMRNILYCETCWREVQAAKNG